MNKEIFYEEWEGLNKLLEIGKRCLIRGYMFNYPNRNLERRRNL